MDNYMMINGKKIPLTDEQIKLITAAQGDPFERVEGEIYYTINPHGELESLTESDDEYDYKAYEIANYCRDKELMEHRAAVETLNRQLWRYAVRNGAKEGDIYYIVADKNLMVMDASWAYRTPGEIRFATEEDALDAIELIVRPWLEKNPWYSTTV